jgi:choline dehydrogenase-like flavoprotein
MWSHLGLSYKPDLNNGQPQSISDLVESWNDGKRQITPPVYPLNGVKVLTGTLVKRIVLDRDKTATGVELANGEVIALEEGGQVVLSAGAYRTPQVLMLSGIGDPAHLSRHRILLQVDLPAVGQNLHDHLLLHRYWKLRHPELSNAIGSPLFIGQGYDKGRPMDFQAQAPLPIEPLKAAIESEDGPTTDDHPLVKGPRTHLECAVPYAAFGAEAKGLDVQMDCTSTVFFMACLPTSRGSITLSSNDPNDAPVIDPNYCATEVDRHVLREGLRISSRLLLDTPEGKEFVEGEHRPPGLPTLGLDATNEEIDARVKVGVSTDYHPAGTAAMGTVVDASLKVYGVANLREVDASVVGIVPLWCGADADPVSRFQNHSRRIIRLLCMVTCRIPLLLTVM